MTVVSHFNKEGKIKSFLLSCIVCEIIKRSIPKDLMIQAAHISGRKNLLAVKSSSGGLDNKIRIDILKKACRTVVHKLSILTCTPTEL